MKYFNCDIKLFANWLKFCFSEEMTMNNHGSVWHLDHVIPISSLDLKNPDKVYLCFNYLNYMPFLSHDNLSKNKKIIYWQLLTHSDNIIIFHIKNNLSY